MKAISQPESQFLNNELGNQTMPTTTEQSGTIGGLQPISRDTDNNVVMYNCWWKNKRS